MLNWVDTGLSEYPTGQSHIVAFLVQSIFQTQNLQEMHKYRSGTVQLVHFKYLHFMRC